MQENLVRGLLNLSNYERIFALDTQMVFEAKPLEQLNWNSISTGPVLLLILPQVSSEVDARKRDGRLATRARNLNRLLDQSIETGEPKTIVELPIRVDLAYVASGQIDWPSLDDLDRNNGDDLIVAQALNALVDNPSRVEIISFDSRPRAAARRHDMGALKPDESWLLEPEPSPTKRRVAELEQEVKLLRKTEPEITVSLRTAGPQPLVKRCIQPIPGNLIDAVSQMVIAKNPREATGGFYTRGLNENTYYDEEYDVYEAEMRERDIPALHKGAAKLFSAYTIEVVLENTGVLAAEHVVVELRSGNTRLHPGPFLVDLFGPPPPSTQRDFIGRLPNLSRQLSRPDRTSFAVEVSENQDVQVEFRCEDFRHGRAHTLTVVLELTDQTAGEAHVEVRITAGNMRGEIKARLLANIVEADTLLGELIDLDNLKTRVPPPTYDLIFAAFKDDEDSIVHFRNDGTRR